jgi:hypothetical protein
MLAMRSITGDIASRKTAQPAPLKSRLPNATRRPPPGVLALTMRARKALPRFAPSTRQNATGVETMCEAANVAASSTAARLDQHRTEKIAPISMSSIGSPESVAKITRTPCASVIGLVASMTSWRASSMRPRPMAIRPIWPAFVLRRDRKKITPRRIASGESQRRSSENAWARRAVPTSAPSMIASAAWKRDQVLRDERGCDHGGRARRLHESGHRESREPGGEAVGGALREEAAQVGAVHAQDAGAHDMRSPDEERDRRKQVEECQHRANLTCGDAECLEVGEALHGFLHALPCSPGPNP